MPYISVIVPVYNAEESIERCVNSIASQGFTDIEILLIDDGSKDRGGMLCDKMAEFDTRIHVIHKKNAGVSAARNTGMDLANGKYLMFVDSDDYLPEHYIEDLLLVHQKFGEESFCWTAIRVVSDNQSVEEKIISYGEEEYSILRRKDVLKLSAKYLLNAPWNKLYCTEIIKKNKLHMDENISIAEDLLFNLQYLSVMHLSQIVVINIASYCYVRNGKPSLDNGYRHNYYDIHKEVLKVLLEYCYKWQVPVDDMPLFYIRYWEYMQTAFLNLDYEDCPLNKFEKFVEKSKIVADKYFQKGVVQRKKNMGRGSYMVLRSRLYLLVWLFEKIK